jgi:hypothetical protein
VKLISMSAAVMAVALTLAGAASAAGPLPLPAPPPATGQTSSAIFDAMEAIARAAGSNPAAAQQAQFSYNAAIQQYNAHDFERARMSALQAISQTAAAPLPMNSIAPPAIPQPAYVRMPMNLDANQADAESYVGLARGALTTCGAPNATPPASATQDYTAAVNALVAKNYRAARASSQNVVNDCSGATKAYMAQQAALPQPSGTPIPMDAYSPVPLATLIPDPALQPGNQ